MEALREGADDYFTKEVGFANYNRLVNTIKNVVDKYQHNQKRKEAEKQASIFKTISDKANYGNAIADPEGNIIYSNNAFAAIHQYPQDELTGMNLSEFIDGKESFLAELKTNLLSRLWKYGTRQEEET